MLMNPGCGASDGASTDKAPDTGQVSLEIRFQDDTAPTPPSSSGAGKRRENGLSSAAAAPWPGNHDEAVWPSNQTPIRNNATMERTRARRGEVVSAVFMPKS
jgi:hypothetical protein